jgi:hypothetical protein
MKGETIDNTIPNGKWNYKVGMKVIREKRPCSIGELVYIKGFKGPMRVKFTYLESFMTNAYGKTTSHPWADLMRVIRGKCRCCRQTISEEIILKH